MFRVWFTPPGRGWGRIIHATFRRIPGSWRRWGPWDGAAAPRTPAQRISGGLIREVSMAEGPVPHFFRIRP